MEVMTAAAKEQSLRYWTRVTIASSRVLVTCVLTRSVTRHAVTSALRVPPFASAGIFFHHDNGNLGDFEGFCSHVADRMLSRDTDVVAHNASRTLPSL